MNYKIKEEILYNYVKPESLREIFNRWEEPHRKFHTKNHLDEVLYNLEKFKHLITSESDWESSILAAYFHDIVYVPGNTDNEDLSTELMLNMVSNSTDDTVLLAKDIILSTKIIGKKVGIFDIFQSADCDVLINPTFSGIFEYEKLIFKEYQRFSWDKYKNGRIDFLNKAVSIFPGHLDYILMLIRHLRDKRPKIGVYAGSFKPFTVGHFNVLNQAENIFDKVVIAYGSNPEKSETDFNPPTTISDREIVKYTGLLPDLLKKYENMGCDVTLVRGLRNEYDLNYEQNLVQYVKDYMPNLKVTFFLCDKKYEHISSGAVRGLQKFGADVTNYLIP